MEAAALERLQHENVVRHFAAWLEEKHFCILMEWAPHGDFASLLVQRWAEADAEGRKFLDEGEVMSYFVQLADGLAHLHEKRVLQYERIQAQAHEELRREVQEIRTSKERKKGSPL